MSFSHVESAKISKFRNLSAIQRSLPRAFSSSLPAHSALLVGSIGGIFEIWYLRKGIDLMLQARAVELENRRTYFQVGDGQAGTDSP